MEEICDPCAAEELHKRLAELKQAWFRFPDKPTEEHTESDGKSLMRIVIRMQTEIKTTMSKKKYNCS
eukprot:5874218-Karenia_brevis.AAC.1